MKTSISIEIFYILFNDNCIDFWFLLGQTTDRLQPSQKFQKLKLIVIVIIIIIVIIVMI